MTHAVGVDEDDNKTDDFKIDDFEGLWSPSWDTSFLVEARSGDADDEVEGVSECMIDIQNRTEMVRMEKKWNQMKSEGFVDKISLYGCCATLMMKPDTTTYNTANQRV